MGSISNEDIDKVVNQRSKQGFIGTLFEGQSAIQGKTLQKYYNEGDRMYAKLKNGMYPFL
jgi:hypothetical protein